MTHSNNTGGDAMGERDDSQQQHRLGQAVRHGVALRHGVAIRHGVLSRHARPLRIYLLLVPVDDVEEALFGVPVW